jgi:hypothetical protein
MTMQPMETHFHDYIRGLVIVLVGQQRRHVRQAHIARSRLEHVAADNIFSVVNC